MIGAELQGDRAITEAPGFDYGAGGRGGWDERSPDVEQARKRKARQRLFEDIAVYLARAEMQGRRPSEVTKMQFRRYKNSNRHLRESCVYLIANILSGDFYIGSSVHVISRWKAHASAMRGRRHPVSRINTLVRKYGVESFRFLILQRCSEWTLLRQEREWNNRMQPTIGRIYQKSGLHPGL